VDDFVNAVAPGMLTRVPRWPPDAFAVAAALLRKTGAYTAIVDRVPPPAGWTAQIESIGTRWRKAFNANGSLPKEVTDDWAVLVSSAGVDLTVLRRKPRLLRSLLRLMATGDNASAGAGIPTRGPDRFDRQTLALLARGDADAPSSLSERVDSSRLVVLPKLHTPQTGLTLRSLSHNLALFEPRDVTPRWMTWPSRASVPESGRALNVLLLPWPLRMRSRDFVMTRAKMPTLAKDYGFFTVRRSGEATLKRVNAVVRAAERFDDRVDIVVLPELALDVNGVRRLAARISRAVIAGVGTTAQGSKAGQNGAAVAIPRGPIWLQHKHHRWRLDARQLEMYGLQARLGKAKYLWEHIDIPPRQLHFLALSSWLTFSVLICEDLARQDPTAELLRAVGPDLVIALLLDGPQLERRWPARYATVLAEDPGSSVLTLTSLGMALLSSIGGNPECRVVALWKDAVSGVREIEMHRGAVGLMLRLRSEDREEFSADGRSDNMKSNHLVLEKVTQIRE
jgi:hypothetical protein